MQWLMDKYLCEATSSYVQVEAGTLGECDWWIVISMVVYHMMGINLIKSRSDISCCMMSGMPPSGWIALGELSFPPIPHPLVLSTIEWRKSMTSQKIRSLIGQQNQPRKKCPLIPVCMSIDSRVYNVSFFLESFHASIFKKLMRVVN